MIILKTALNCFVRSCYRWTRYSPMYSIKFIYPYKTWRYNSFCCSSGSITRGVFCLAISNELYSSGYINIMVNICKRFLSTECVTIHVFGLVQSVTTLILLRLSYAYCMPSICIVLPIVAYGIKILLVNLGLGCSSNCLTHILYFCKYSNVDYVSAL